MQVLIDAPLTNGMLDSLKDPANDFIGGFIFGALDRGYMVRWPGVIEVKYGKWSIMVHPQFVNVDKRKIYFLYGSQQRHEMPVDGFKWKNVKITKDCLYINHQLIRST